MGLASEKRTLRCTSCGRSFARAEHLTRHQRSHRNEKPFKCSYCDSTFTRKDVIKRHTLRYHPGILENARQSPLQQQPENITTQSSLMPARPLGSESYQNDNFMLPSTIQPGLDLNDTIGAFLADLDYGAVSSNEFQLNNFGGGSSEYLNLDVPFPSSPLATSSTSSLSTELNSHQSWRGSTGISAAKRNQIMKEADDVITQLSISVFPSRLAFERLLTTFFEIFPLYLPFIHIPTWRAEMASPCLLQSMAALSASFNKEHKAAQDLYQAARRSVTKQLESSYAWTTEQPVWLVQSILILMACGVSSGKLGTFNEALLWAPLLANIVRCKQTPEAIIPEDDAELFMTWERWIEYETTVRTKCAVFCFLNNLTVCFNVAPPLLDWEMGCAFLPCSESQWLCTTPESWFEGRTPPLRAVKTSSFGAYVILHALLQRMWRFKQDMWMRWQVCWEENSESSSSPSSPHGAVSSNAAALLRLVHMQLYTDFSAVRSAIVSHDVEKIVKSMKELTITIDHSNSSLKTISHAINALRTRIRMGMALKGGCIGSHHNFQLHLVSIECCLFANAWMKEISTRPEAEWTTDEDECVKLVKETLGEIELDQVNAYKPYSTQLVYAWALIFDCCAVWGLQSILTAALKKFADSLS
ncbi:hypothetical protein DL95DRAFT_438620 [Leptodontidium sp. 2 PMI_412]|nr:hypothetical protein DL95DRAFT_438620 [Leptodontidium sp. 2 PMI_412]